MKDDFLSIFDISKSGIEKIIARAFEHREMSKTPAVGKSLEGKTVGIVFEKPSTRTRVSFEAAAAMLGAHPVFIDTGNTQIDRGETLEDTAKVLSSYLDIIVMRTHGQERLEQFAGNSSVPVINALSDLEHPTQALSDIFTIAAQNIDIESFKLAYIGDGNNVANSLIGISSILGFDITIAAPDGCEPDWEIMNKSGKNNGRASHITITRNPGEAVQDADVIYTDVWVSMGRKESPETREKFMPYQVNAELLSNAPKDAVVMHCLPAHRGEEITAEVMSGKRFIAFEQAENKLHMAKAVLEHFLKWDGE